MEKLDEVLDRVPNLPFKEVTLASLEEVEPGTFKLEEMPTAQLLQELPQYKNGFAEVGIFCIKNQWLISLNTDMHTELPDALKSIQHENVFQIDMHTHPGEDPGSRQPSNSDIYHLDSTIDKKNYIISSSGLIEFQWMNKLPGNFSKPTEVNKAWEHWICNDLKLTEEEFNQRDAWKLKEEFYKTFFNLKIIPWEEDEIRKILSDKEKE